MSVLRAGDNGHERGPRAPRLDDGTELVGSVWGVNWWPDSGEAVAYVARTNWRREELEDVEADARSMDPRAVEDRRRENRERAARRAMKAVRLYVTANNCTRMLTLTFAPQNDRPCGAPVAGSEADEPARGRAMRLHPAGSTRPNDSGGRCACGRPSGPDGLRLAMRLSAAFMRRLRDAVNAGESHAYVLVPEYHRDGHVHVHVLLPFYARKALVRRLWGHGHVDARKIRTKDAGGREAARRAAAYAAKYLGKTFDVEGQVVSGAHRYEVGEGFQPTVVKRAGFGSAADALDFVLDHGRAVVYAVASTDLDDYEGPPWLWVVLERVATA